MERQFFAANGYAVLAVNYRGSSGRGMKYSRAIFADWGHYEVEDLQAGVDYVIKMGVADPDKLGVGGWSYGGILTDYMIASDTRFKASHQRRRYCVHGRVLWHRPVHHSVRLRNRSSLESRNRGRPIRKSPIRFCMPTASKRRHYYLGGERDFNVPVQGGQQMYEALRSLGSIRSS